MYVCKAHFCHILAAKHIEQGRFAATFCRSILKPISQRVTNFFDANLRKSNGLHFYYLPFVGILQQKKRIFEDFFSCHRLEITHSGCVEFAPLSLRALEQCVFNYSPKHVFLAVCWLGGKKESLGIYSSVTEEVAYSKKEWKLLSEKQDTKMSLISDSAFFPMVTHQG
jgi:hypothetical protein